MSDKLIYLPASTPARCRVLQMPNDMEAHEAFRNITGIIARLEELGESDPDELDDAFESNGFKVMDLAIGPELP